MSEFSYLSGNHDLSLPDWGPYSKKFFGISHLADKQRGTRFDFTVVPAIYRRQLAVPDALRPSGYLPWDISPDLENYSYRQQLEWRDVVYADISFSRIDDHARLIRCELVNNSDLNTDFALHLLSTLFHEPIAKVEPVNCVWVDAITNHGVEPVRMTPQDALNHDGLRRREQRFAGSVGGSVIGNGFGRDAGDKIVFSLPDAPGCCYLRYRSNKALDIEVNGQAVELPATAEWSLFNLGGFKRKLEIVSGGGAELMIDGIAIAETEPQFTAAETGTRPEFTTGRNSVIIRYPGLKHSYGLWWGFDSDFVRHYSVNDFMHELLYDDGLHQRFLKGFDHNGKDNYLDAVMQPLPVAAHSSRTFYAMICDGTPAEVEKRLKHIPGNLDEIYRQGAGTYLQLPTFGQSRMAAVTLSNVVYPTYVCGKYVRHHSPGRRWNCLYTWDSGFIGLGMLEFSTQRAIESLNAYLTEAGDMENAFIQHGSLVPVQIYLYLELWNRTRDREMLRFFYPRVKQYYDFHAGHNPLSRTRKRSNAGLICTWDYFYNSGGWDDYPPQWEVHSIGARNIVPAVNTSHAIRCAKILQAAAIELGLDDDYQDDIDIFTQALQQHSWDPKCGYFSYVVHDENGDPQEFFRYADGTNFNMGLDGASPLIAGIPTPEQREILWNHLGSPEHCWTDIGLSTVDQSAPYYRSDGYWNGSVWMPHQWFFWKAALNDGKGDFAWRIAETALKLWERETGASYACYEQFNISSGRGSGWHHFSALSAPVLCWHGAYFTPGRLTTGYDVWQRSCTFDGRGLAAELVIGGNAGDQTTVLAVVTGTDCKASYRGIPCEVTRRGDACEIVLPKNTSGTLHISS